VELAQALLNHCVRLAVERPASLRLLGDGDHRLQDRVDDLARWTLDFVADRRRSAPSSRA
jgi:hypothetical protein